MHTHTHVSIHHHSTPHAPSLPLSLAHALSAPALGCTTAISLDWYESPYTHTCMGWGLGGSGLGGCWGELGETSPIRMLYTLSHRAQNPSSSNALHLPYHHHHHHPGTPTITTSHHQHPHHNPPPPPLQATPHTRAPAPPVPPSCRWPPASQPRCTHPVGQRGLSGGWVAWWVAWWVLVLVFWGMQVETIRLPARLCDRR